MKECIERKAVLDIVTEWCPDDDGSVGKTGDLRDMLDELEAIPAADVVEVRHGHWSMLSYDEAVCTRCGYNQFTPFDCTREARDHWGELPPYCEMCGAKMDGGVGND